MQILTSYQKSEIIFGSLAFLVWFSIFIYWVDFENYSIFNILYTTLAFFLIYLLGKISGNYIINNEYI